MEFILAKAREYKNFLAGTTGISLSTLGIMIRVDSVFDELGAMATILANFTLALASIATFIWLITQSIDRGEIIKERWRKRRAEKKHNRDLEALENEKQFKK